MDFKEIRFCNAFYDSYWGTVFYSFDTVPKIGHGHWAISEGGDAAYNLLNDYVTQRDFPDELLELLEYIPDNVEIEGLEDE